MTKTRSTLPTSRSKSQHPESTGKYWFVVHGQLASKANSRRVVRDRNGVRSIRSATALLFVDRAILQLRRQWRRRPPIRRDVGLNLIVYYPSKRNDLDPQLLFDVIQKVGIYVNDRQIREFYCRKEWDKMKPRVEFEIYTLDSQETECL